MEKMKLKMDTKFIEKLKLNEIIDSLCINRICESKLKIEKKLATAGQGKIKLAIYNNSWVIIKILHNLNVRDYTSEVLNADKYRHQNIPKFLGVYQSEKDFGMVFEYIEGLTLNRIISLEKSGKLKLTFLSKL